MQLINLLSHILQKELDLLIDNEYEQILAGAGKLITVINKYLQRPIENPFHNGRNTNFTENAFTGLQLSTNLQTIAEFATAINEVESETSSLNLVTNPLAQRRMDVAIAGQSNRKNTCRN